MIVAADFFLPDTVEDVGRDADRVSDSVDRGGRPPGDLRAIVIGALCEHGPLPLREIAEVKRLDVPTARHTVKNMRRAGLLEVVGYQKRAHCRRWVALYDVALERTRFDPWQALIAWAHLRSR